jgi:hypothetical protein
MCSTSKIATLERKLEQRFLSSGRNGLPSFWIPIFIQSANSLAMSNFQEIQKALPSKSIGNQ